jgi:tetratricopeptide (TPR) repeat protein
MCNVGLQICISSQNKIEEAHFYVTKARNNFNQNEYKYALSQLEYAERINKQENNEEVFDRIYFNKGMVYKKMKEYDIAIKYFKKLKDKYKIANDRKLLDIKMEYANCLNEQFKIEEEQHKFKEAEKEYISVLELAMKLNDKDFVARAYRNLSELYLNQNNYEYAAILIKESLKNNPSNAHLGENLTFAASVVKNIKEDPEKYLLQALDICEKNDKENLILIEKIIYELVLIYIERETENGLNLMIKKSEELKIEYDLIFPELSEYYRHRNEEKSINLNKKLIEKSKIRKNI